MRTNTMALFKSFITVLLIFAIMFCSAFYLQIDRYYTKTMMVVSSDNTQTIVKDIYTNKEIALNKVNTNKATRCKVVFNTKGTDYQEDDTIEGVKWE